VIKTNLTKIPVPLTPFEDEDPYYYTIITRSCSTQRYRQIKLARLIPLTSDCDKYLKNVISDTLKLKTHKFFFLPSTKDQENNVLGNLASFEEISLIQQDDLKTVSRVESLSELGFHLLNAFLNFHHTRPSPEDLVIRRGTTKNEVTIS
jgi:hypothetical protein